MSSRFFIYKCKISDDIKALMKSINSRLDIKYEGDSVYVYQNYHRYIREHQLKGIAVHKKGDIIYLQKT